MAETLGTLTQQVLGCVLEWMRHGITSSKSGLNLLTLPIRVVGFIRFSYSIKNMILMTKQEKSLNAYKRDLLKL